MADIAITETSPYHLGDTIHFHQEGGDVAQPNEELDIILTRGAGDYGTVTTVTADGAGSFSGSFVIPGDVTLDVDWSLRAVGLSSILVSGTFTIAAASTSTGAPRGRIGVSGLSLGL